MESDERTPGEENTWEGGHLGRGTPGERTPGEGTPGEGDPGEEGT